MNRAVSGLLSLSLILFCLAIQHQGQTKPSVTKSSRKTSSSSKDLSTWQTVSLGGKGIKFKLPPDWRDDDVDLSKRSAGFVIEEVQWSPPDKDTPNKATIQIFVSTYRAGFVSNERTASSKEKIQEEFDLVTRSAQRKENNSSYSEVKKLKVSGVEGVFYVMRFNFEDKDRGLREEINWTAYRIYQGKAAKIDINIGASPKSDDLLRTIFSTLEILDEITLRNRAVDDPALTNHRRTIRSGQEIQLTTSAWPCGTV